MNSNEVICFLYQLHTRDIRIWANQDKLKLFLPKGIKLTTVESEKIRENKTEILAVCKHNDLTSQVSHHTILKSLEHIAPLSFSQEGLWFLEQYDIGTSAYHVPISFELSKKTSPNNLKIALLHIIQRHTILRSLLKANSDGRGQQHVIENISLYPLIKEHAVKSLAELHKQIAKENKQLFNLAVELPLRIIIYKVTDVKKYYCHLVVHHVAIDGWSIDCLTNELKCLLDAIASKVPFESVLERLPIQYSDFALWQRAKANTSYWKNELDYWLSQLSELPILNLPVDRPRPAQFNYHGDVVLFQCSQQVSQQLRQLAQKLDVSLYSVLLSGFSLLLGFFSHQNDIVLGTPIANRHYPLLEKLIGCFVNSLALRIKINFDDSLKAFISQVGQLVFSSQMHQNLPFEKLVEALKLKKDTSRHPVFQIMFALQNFGSQSGHNNDWLTPYFVPCSDKTTQFDMTIIWDDSELGLKGSIRYATALFDKSTIERYIQTYQYLLEKFTLLLNNQYLSLKSLELITGKAKEQQLTLWNGAKLRESPQGLTLISSFLQSAEKNTKKIALIDENGSITYEDLKKKVFTLAQELLVVNLKQASKLVAILSEKGRVQVISALAIMQTGKAYLPLNIEWPNQRLAEVLSSGQVETILVSPTIAKKMKAFLANYSIIIVDDNTIDSRSRPIKTLPVVLPSEIAYVIFTSGSTGKPKGVTISHQGAMNTIAAVNQQFNLSSEDRVFALSELSFDLSVYDIFGLLAVGGTVVFPKQSLLKDPLHWLQQVKEHKVSIWNTVPQLAGLLAHEASLQHQKLPHLRLCLVSGDWISLTLPKQLNILNNKMTIMSLGGATEGSIWSIWYQIKNIKPQWSSIPYGLAMPNQKIFVMTATEQLCPIGAIGEIQIGGTGVALNYWDDFLKTSKSFYEHPEFGRLYRTGDFGLWHPDGYIKFMGRRDTQVKLGGFRIELGDIQAALNNVAEISQSIAMICTIGANNTKAIVAYYVSKAPLNSKTLKKIIAEKLPLYMIPSFWVHLSKLPLTDNGKLDHQALPVPKVPEKLSSVHSKSPLEKALCEAYALVLGIDPDLVGIDDDFFTLGGDSILSIQLVSRLRHSLSLPITVKLIFQHRTVRFLAEQLLKSQAIVPKSNMKESGLLTGSCELLPIQKWFFTQNFPFIGYWNQAFMVCLPKNLDKIRLRKCLAILISYHDAFRLRYKLKNGDYEQFYATQPQMNKDDFETLQIDFQDKAQVALLKKTLTNWQCHFDITKGPMYHFGLIEGYLDEYPRLHVACHHLLIDSVSWRLLVDDLNRLYNACIQKSASVKLVPEMVLGIKGTSYRQWAKHITQKYKNNHPYQQYYWHNILADYHRNDFEHVVTQVKQRKDFSLSTSLTEALLKKCNQAYHTYIDEVLLTAFGVALKLFTGNAIQHILLEGHGRETLQSTDLSHTMGWFTTLYPVRLDCSDCCLETQLEMVKENLRAVPDKGLGYGILIGYEKNTLPQVRFNYLGQFQQSKTSQREWNIINENVGECIHSKNHDSVVLDVNCMIVDQKLHFQLDAFFSKLDLANFSAQFERQLQQLITLLLKTKSSHWSLSDCQDEAYTLMNSEQANKQCPLIMLPTGDGGYESYLNTLMPHLSHRYAMLFNNPYDLLQKSQPHYANELTIEKLAQLTIALIKTVQPIGPYRLFGWSFGGVLALEIAYQLLQRGDSVNSVVMVDALFDLDDYYASQEEKPLKENHLLNKYHPAYNNVNWNGVRILLLKAKRPIDDNSNVNYCLFKYYVTMTQSNNLDHYLAPECFQVQLFDSDHLSWITNSEWQKFVVSMLV